MRGFNTLQLVTLFAVCPFIIGWLAKAPFAYSGAVFWVSNAAYVCLFAFITFLVYIGLQEIEK